MAEPNEPQGWVSRLKNIWNIEVTDTAIEFAETATIFWTAAMALGSGVSSNSGYKRAALFFVYGIFAGVALQFLIKSRHKIFKARKVAWVQCTLLVGLNVYFGAMGIISLNSYPLHFPTLLTLWASEDPETNEIGHIDYKFGKDNTHFYYKIVQDFKKGQSYLTLYFPDTSHVVEASAQLIKDWPYYARNFGDKPVMDRSGSLISVPTLKFTGNVFVYHDVYIPDDERRAISNIFKKVGTRVQYRGEDYRTKIGNLIFDHKMSQPPDYIIKDGVACRVTERTKWLEAFRSMFSLGKTGAEYDDRPFTFKLDACREVAGNN